MANRYADRDPRLCRLAVPLLAFFMLAPALATVAQDSQKSVRDVTPDGVLRVYQSQQQNFPVVPDGERPFNEIEVLRTGILKSKEFTIQLFGIEIPDRNMTCTYASGARWACGLRAHAALRNLVAGRSIKCAITAEAGNALIGQCRLNQADIALSLLDAGWVSAASYVQDPRYVGAEAAAKKKAAGMWSQNPSRGGDSILRN